MEQICLSIIRNREICNICLERVHGFLRKYEATVFITFSFDNDIGGSVVQYEVASLNGQDFTDSTACVIHE